MQSRKVQDKRYHNEYWGLIKLVGSKIVAADSLVVDHVNAGEDVFIVLNKDYVPNGK